MIIAGFSEMCNNKSLLYRVHDFPGLAFMIKMEVYETRMKGNLKLCCNTRYVGDEEKLTLSLIFDNLYYF